MRRDCVTSATVAVLLLLLSLTALSSARPVRAADTWDVIVGGDEVDSAITSYAYWPSTLTIRTGDTVRWSFFSQVEHHTVSFLRGSEAPSVYVPGPDAGELSYGPAWFPIGTIASLGTFDNTQNLSSGALFGATPPTYSLSFSTPGVFTYSSLLHPGMRGSVTVLDSDASLSETPEQALARGQQDFQDRIAALQAQIVVLSAAPDALLQSDADAPAVHTVSIGLTDPGGASALQFFPSNLTVQRGDTVVWTNADAYGAHTVTFTSGAPPPDVPSVRSSGPPVLVLAANVVGASGGSSYPGVGYWNSGLLQPAESAELTVDAPPGMYEYVDLLHPDVMYGTITVTGNISP